MLVSTRKELWINNSRKCGICGRFMKLKDLTIDHIIPKSKGGANRKENYQPAHKICNGVKGNSMPGELKGKLSVDLITEKKKIKILIYGEKAINTNWEKSQRSMVEMFKVSREVLQNLLTKEII